MAAAVCGISEQQQVKRILRPGLIHNGPKGSKPGSLPVAKTTFWKDYVHRSDEPGPNIPGTNVARLTLIPLGDKSVGVLEDDVDRVIVQLAAERLTDSQKRLARRAATKAGQERAREQRAKAKLPATEKAAAARSAAD
jgi:hypothetical protein